jgi:hypothetical protein
MSHNLVLPLGTGNSQLHIFPKIYFNAIIPFTQTLNQISFSISNTGDIGMLKDWGGNQELSVLKDQDLIFLHIHAEETLIYIHVLNIFSPYQNV